MERFANAIPDQPGWLYVVQLDTPDAPVKIGISRQKTPQARVDLIRCHVPYAVIPIGIQKTARPRRTELALHETFQTQRLRGEWFRLSVCDIEWLKQACSLSLEGEAYP